MKKQVTKEVKVCDFCGAVDAFWQCTGCEKDACYACREDKAGVLYRHGVFFQGAGDGFYCGVCDFQHKDTPLHKAYEEIQQLRKEYDHWQHGFSQRTERAHDALNKLLG